MIRFQDGRSSSGHEICRIRVRMDFYKLHCTGMDDTRA
jgi:hypothetical protein